MKDSISPVVLAVGNVVTSAFMKCLEGAEPLLHSLLGLGQVLVAGATFVYLVVKIRAAKRNKKTDDE